MFITALFIIARTWKQPRRPSADEWIRKLWYIYTMEYYIWAPSPLLIATGGSIPLFDLKGFPPFPVHPPGDLRKPGIEPKSPILQADSFFTS